MNENQLRRLLSQAVHVELMSCLTEGPIKDDGASSEIGFHVEDVYHLMVLA